MKIVAIIQARMGSTRLPGKVLMDVEGKPVLQHVIERVKEVKRIDKIIILTTRDNNNNVIIELAKKEGIDYIRGPEDDVLNGFVLAAKKTNADVIVRVMGECLLLDPVIIDEGIERFFRDKLDYIGNETRRSFPRGLDFAVLSFSTLKKADELGKMLRHRRHVTPFIYENPQIFKIGYLTTEGILKRPNIRLCVDTKQDLELIRIIYKNLYKGRVINILEVIKFLDENPELLKINAQSELEHLKKNEKEGIKQERVQSR